MKITLLVTAFNSLTQVAYSYFKEKKYNIDVVFAINEKQMIDEVFAFSPDFILCPFLKKFVPKEIYENIDTYIVHPGVLGDRGAYAIDNAIRLDKKEWGVTILKANGMFDSGDVVITCNFRMRSAYKSSIYRNEVITTFYSMLDDFLKNRQSKKFILQPDLPMHQTLSQKERAIDWQKDTTQEILKKIYMSDSYPGVKDEILGVECYLYGAWREEKLRGEPKEILAKRDGAVCLGTVDGAIWITHLKEPNRFKLPATYVLKERLQGVKEQRLPLIFDKSYKTFYEISCDIREEVAYLYFNFHNGAFSSDKCMKLKYAFEYIKEQVKIVVLMGGEDFFSNGIHLNILEDSKKNGEDGWSNINAMNDLVKSILFADEVITVASLSKNAGAGGVFLALACDYVVACNEVVLNPHYKTLGLSGSEYHSYLLPKRTGKQMAEKILEECLPMNASQAREIGLVDKLFMLEGYEQSLKNFCLDLLFDEDAYEDFIWKKGDYLQENKMMIEGCRKKEIEIMYPEFWEKESVFHTLRYEFVYKICPQATPKRLKGVECA
ncbi:hydrogenase [Sulfurimonas sediminis]|uniref:Hydrogenase n=1 Tax=Sulfurimonas sediminis TaxID=2590020 RepID=A0A7M1B0U5_9BACT|nr:enoyl-CoA hydratase-related protein [Sulfurimonas sediminis]QOP43387.1 hydrogenase [Sulfurimonas sediminis]